MTDLTTNEELMLISVFNCHYGDEGDCIWAWAHNDSRKPHNLAKTTASGVIGSLCKKGLMTSYDDKVKADSTCGLTDKGREIARELDASDDEPDALMIDAKGNTKRESETNVRYVYPAGLTAAQKKTFRAKARKAAKKS